MRYYKRIENGYIVSIGTGPGATEITEAEYSQILQAIEDRPEETATAGYRLKTDLTWESYEREPPAESDSDEMSEDEILAAIQEAMA